MTWHNVKKIISISSKIILILALAVLLLMLVCDFVVTHYAKGRIYDDIDSIPCHSVGLLLGTAPITSIGGYTNRFFTYRIDAAEKLFKSGKISKIIISGDGNSLNGIDETACMRDSLVARGVPSDRITLDPKGFRTLNSIVRTTEVYREHSFIIISQKFHNERALYQAMHFDLGPLDISAFNAKSAWLLKTYIREYFARVILLIDLLRKDELKAECYGPSDRETHALFFN